MFTLKNSDARAAYLEHLDWCDEHTLSPANDEARELAAHFRNYGGPCTEACAAEMHEYRKRFMTPWRYLIGILAAVVIILLGIPFSIATVLQLPVIGLVALMSVMLIWSVMTHDKRMTHIHTEALATHCPPLGTALRTTARRAMDAAHHMVTGDGVLPPEPFHLEFLERLLYGEIYLLINRCISDERLIMLQQLCDLVRQRRALVDTYFDQLNPEAHHALEHGLSLKHAPILWLSALERHAEWSGSIEIPTVEFDEARAAAVEWQIRFMTSLQDHQNNVEVYLTSPLDEEFDLKAVARLDEQALPAIRKYLEAPEWEQYFGVNRAGG